MSNDLLTGLNMIKIVIYTIAVAMAKPVRILYLRNSIVKYIIDLLIFISQYGTKRSHIAKC